MDGFFRFSEKGTSLRTEVIAGLTTFMTMAYIIFVNPAILGTEGTGLPVSGVFFATCVAAAAKRARMEIRSRPFLLPYLVSKRPHSISSHGASRPATQALGTPSVPYARDPDGVVIG